jgi:hypothetical protein
VRHCAVTTTAELLGGMTGREFWSGVPWKLWVTDQPGGAGETVLMLEFSAKPVLRLVSAGR